MPEIGRATSKRATDWILALVRERLVAKGYEVVASGRWDAKAIQVFSVRITTEECWADWSLDLSEISQGNTRDEVVKWIIDPRLERAMRDIAEFKRRKAGV